MKSSHAAIRERVTSPGRCEQPVSEQVLIGYLAHESPAVRRNAALQVILQQASLRVRNACMAALAREEDRKARLALLLAIRVCWSEENPTDLPDYCQPANEFESEVLGGLAQGLICWEILNMPAHMFPYPHFKSHADDVEGDDLSADSTGYGGV
jgi:hypothetical protein